MPKIGIHTQIKCDLNKMLFQANLEVKGGTCRGTEEVCKDTECKKMDYQYPPKK
jgi:hypothetical protein